jgi:hypothetical protein
LIGCVIFAPPPPLSYFINLLLLLTSKEEKLDFIIYFSFKHIKINFNLQLLFSILISASLDKRTIQQYNLQQIKVPEDDNVGLKCVVLITRTE